MTMHEALAASSDHNGHRIAYHFGPEGSWTALMEAGRPVRVTRQYESTRVDSGGLSFWSPQTDISPPEVTWPRFGWTPRLCECHPSSSAPHSTPPPR